MKPNLLIFIMLLSPLFLRAELTEEDFSSLKKELNADKSETWKSIPWKLSVLDAQKAASISKKPIFIWAMDGHPLACV